MRPVIRRIVPLALAPLLACAAPDESGPIAPDPVTISLQLTAPHTMALTTSFNCIDCPVFENGRPFLKISTSANVPSPFGVRSGACYRCGGLFLFGGNVWSESVCVP